MSKQPLSWNEATLQAVALRLDAWLKRNPNERACPLSTLAQWLEGEAFAFTYSRAVKAIEGAAAAGRVRLEIRALGPTNHANATIFVLPGPATGAAFADPTPK